MPKASAVSASRTHEPPLAKALVQATGQAAGSPKIAPEAAPKIAPKIASVTPSGPRKLIRPRLPAMTRPAMTREDGRNLRHPPVLTAQQLRGGIVLAGPVHDPSHAEMYYLRKQAQDQTPMVFVLDDGERIEGCIEWYDRHAIKVRNGARTLIYKSSIKYLYKATEKGGRNRLGAC